MKAVVVENFGDLNQIQIKDVPTPSPKGGEVKIAVRYASVNPVEWKLTAGILNEILPAELPMILGWDVSGVVVEVGEGVTSLQEGDEVFGYCRGPIVHAGTFAEYFCFSAEHVVPKPKNLSFAQAAALPLVSLTAWQAMVDVAKLGQGQTCLIHAGAGGVGSVAIPLACWCGAWVATTASRQNHDYVTSLGADLAIDYKTTSFPQKIKELHPKGVDFVLDGVGGVTLQESYSIVKKGGWLVSIVETVDKDAARDLGINAKTVIVRSDGKELWKIKELVEAGTLPCPAVEEMRLDQVVEALAKVQTQHTRGKIVLKVS